MKLLIEDDEGRKVVVPIASDGAELTIGREDGNGVRLTDRNISRKHARLTHRDGLLFLEDLGSFNGIKINGDRISGSQQVWAGDLIQIGDYDLAIEPEGDELTAASGRQAVPKQRGEAIFDEAAELETRHHSSRTLTDLPLEKAPRLLIITPAELFERQLPCTHCEITIGRARTSDLAINHRSISPSHCKLLRDEMNQWRIVDLQSSAGVKVNGAQFAERLLRAGDEIELGQVKLRFLFPWQLGLEATQPIPVLASRRKRMLAIGACGIGAVVLGLMIYFATRGTEPAPKPPQSEIRLPPARRLQAIDETTLPAPFPQEQLRATPPDTRRFSPGMLDYEEPFEPPRRSRLPEYRTFRNWDDDFGEASPFGKYPAERFHSHRALVDDALARAYQDEELERKRTAQLEEKRRIEIKHQAAADLSQGKSLASETRGRHAEAIPFLESALQADPLLAEAHRYLGLCYTKTGDAKKGAFHYEEFLHQRPADPHAPAIRQILRSYFGKTGEKPRWPIPND